MSYAAIESVERDAYGDPDAEMFCTPLSIAMIGTRGLPASYGGVEVAVEQLSKQLVKRGHKVVVYGRSAYCDAGLREIDGVEQVSLPQINTKHLEALTHTALATAHAVSSRRFDLLHFHATGPTMLSLTTRPLGMPTVATVHGLDWRREKWGKMASQCLRLAARVAAKVPDATIVVSKTLERALNEQYRASTTYIPNGVSLESVEEQSPVEGLEPGAFFLHLGRLVPEKQAHTLIRAFEKVRCEHRLAIVGPASHSSDYLREIRALAARDERVLLLGPRYGAEKAWLLRHAAAFVQPSTLEGLPISLLEALAADQLTIVSDISENLEAVTFGGDRPHGLVFRAGDVSHLATKLSEAVADAGGARRDRRVGMAEQVRLRYDWETVSRETESVYRRALARLGPSRSNGADLRLAPGNQHSSEPVGGRPGHLPTSTVVSRRSTRARAIR